MCLRPVTINKKNPSAGLGSLQGLVYVPSRNGDDFFEAAPVYSKIRGYSRSVMTVPCGKCVECLKARQNDLSIRAIREASKRGSMVFLTLTYDNSTLPLSIHLEKVDKDTGEIVENTEFGFTQVDRSKFGREECTPEFAAACRSDIAALRASPHARLLVKPFVETPDGFYYQYVITPSLNRLDVRLWLKRCRVRYKRDFGKPLPDFSYIVCGEYGPKTCRPHYHVCFFGLLLKDVLYMAAFWKERFGFYDCKQVKPVNDDGTNGFEIAGRYIGKYMSKGQFECDSVKCRISEKPRLMISRYLGNSLDNNLISYYRAYDLFGAYDLQSLTIGSNRLSDSQLSVLFQEVMKRSFVVFNGRKYRLPKSMSKYLWYVKSPDSVYRASEFRALYSDFIQANYVGSDSVKSCSCDSYEQTGSFVPQDSEFSTDIEDYSRFEEALQFDALRRFYSQSKF